MLKELCKRRDLAPNEFDHLELYKTGTFKGIPPLKQGWALVAGIDHGTGETLYTPTLDTYLEDIKATNVQFSAPDQQSKLNWWFAHTQNFTPLKNYIDNPKEKDEIPTLPLNTMVEEEIPTLPLAAAVKEQREEIELQPIFGQSPDFDK